MKLLFVTLILLGLSGCANMRREEWKPGQRPSLSFVIKDNGGCQEKIGVRSKGVYYKKCF